MHIYALNWLKMGLYVTHKVMINLFMKRLYLSRIYGKTKLANPMTPTAISLITQNSTDFIGSSSVTTLYLFVFRS